MKFAALIALVATRFCALCAFSADRDAADVPRDRIHTVVDDAIPPLIAKDNIPGVAVGITIAGKSWLYRIRPAAPELRASSSVRHIRYGSLAFRG